MFLAAKIVNHLPCQMGQARQVANLERNEVTPLFAGRLRGFATFNKQQPGSEFSSPEILQRNYEDSGNRDGLPNPSFFTRDIKVVGFNPNNSAAPPGPWIFQHALRKAAATFSRSSR